MAKIVHTQRPYVVENPSSALLAFVDKLRDMKMNKLEELRNKKSFYFPNEK